MTVKRPAHYRTLGDAIERGKVRYVGSLSNSIGEAAPGLNDHGLSATFTASPPSTFESPPPATFTSPPPATFESPPPPSFGSPTPFEMSREYQTPPPVMFGTPPSRPQSTIPARTGHDDEQFLRRGSGFDAFSGFGDGDWAYGDRDVIPLRQHRLQALSRSPSRSSVVAPILGELPSKRSADSCHASPAKRPSIS